MTEVTGIKIRTFMRNSAHSRACRADLGCRFEKNWRGLFTLLLVFGVVLLTYVTPSAAQLPDFPGPPPSNLPDVPVVPQPRCVSCGPGYHCVHNPEGCEPDEPKEPVKPQKEPDKPLQQPKPE